MLPRIEVSLTGTVCFPFVIWTKNMKTDWGRSVPARPEVGDQRSEVRSSAKLLISDLRPLISASKTSNKRENHDRGQRKGQRQGQREEEEKEEENRARGLSRSEGILDHPEPVLAVGA